MNEGTGTFIPAAPPAAETLSEDDVRALRDAIYGEGSDNNWEACKERWLKPEGITWLMAHQPGETFNAQRSTSNAQFKQGTP